MDILQFPCSRDGNKYAIVFMDYLTKWPEVFATSDQTAATIAELLVEQIITRHGIPSEILSDRGRAFVSGLMEEVEKLMGFHKVNTTAYHPQTDGLVERFNHTLTAMLAKTVEKGGRDWDQHLPYVLFAYRASQQDSTMESPFFLLYGRDPRLPISAILSPPTSRSNLNVTEYGVELATKMSSAWELARKSVRKAQKKQKKYFDRKAKPSPFQNGDRVFLFKPGEKSGAARKLSRPFRVVEVSDNNASIRPVDKPQEEPILVALDRLRKCPDELTDKFWPKQQQRRGRTSAITKVKSPEDG